MMTDKKLFKLVFINHDQTYEIYARSIYQSDLFGFITVEGIQFNEGSSTLVVDPNEERLKHEFKNVKRLFVPMHSIIRIEEVKKTGPAKIGDVSDKIAHLHAPVYAKHNDIK